MKPKPWRSLIPPLLISTGILASAGATAQQASKLEPLVIQEQGSFAVGGTVVTAPGTFDAAQIGRLTLLVHGDACPRPTRAIRARRPRRLTAQIGAWESWRQVADD